MSSALFVGGVLPGFASAEDNSTTISENYTEEDLTLNFNLNTMNAEEKEAFYQAVNEEANSKGSNREAYKKALIGIFNPEASNFNDLEATVNLINKNPFCRFPIMSVNVLGSILNVTISTLITGSLAGGAVSAYIKKVGKEEAKRIFTKSIKSKLIAIGAGPLAIRIKD
jgi:hypothetical protein